MTVTIDHDVDVNHHRRDEGITEVISLRKDNLLHRPTITIDAVTKITITVAEDRRLTTSTRTTPMETSGKEDVETINNVDNEDLDGNDVKIGYLRILDLQLRIFATLTKVEDIRGKDVDKVSMTDPWRLSNVSATMKPTGNFSIPLWLMLIQRSIFRNTSLILRTQQGMESVVKLITLTPVNS